jgi:hypothetical protein
MMNQGATSREYVASCSHDHDPALFLFLAPFPFRVAVNLTSPVPLWCLAVGPNAGG